MHKKILYDRAATLPAIRSHLHRPRIDKILTTAFHYPLVTVTAGAGWGKTQAVSSFLRHKKQDYIWLNLSPLHNLTIQFWENFVHATGIHNPELAYNLNHAGFPDSKTQFHDFLIVFANSIARIDKLALVFDDLHLINEPPVLHFIENLILAQLKNVTIVLINRTRPGLRLHGLYAVNSACQLIENALYFTQDEAMEYFTQQHISLSKQEFREIYAVTRGWITAICLIGLSLKANNNELQNAFDAAKEQIYNLIEEEIFSQHSVELQQCLIKLALFENIPYDVIMDYSTDSLHLTDEIEKLNLFLPFNPITKTYDIHPLLLRFLLKKQTRLTDRELKEAHLKTADWFHNHGFQISALPHYRKCGRYEEIWDIIYHYDVEIPNELAAFFLELIKEFPDNIMKAYPLIPVVHARLLLNNGKIKKSKSEFISIINKYDTPPLTREKRAIAGEAYLFLGIISLLSYDYKFTEYFKTADTYLPGHSTLISHKLSFSQGGYHLLIKDSSPGEVQRFVDAIMEAFPHGVRAMNGVAYGAKYLAKAAAAYHTCDMKEAKISSCKAICQAERNAQLETLCAAYFLLVRIHFNAGNFTKAVASITELKEKLAASQSVHHTKYRLFSYDIMIGWFYSRLGIYDKVPDWILKEELRIGVLSPHSLGIDHLIRAYYLLENEKYYELAALAETLSHYYNNYGLLPARLDIEIYRAVAAYKIGDISQSMEALQNAYNLAVGNELFMPFIELGKYMRAVIYMAKNSDINTIPDEWLSEINAKATTYEKRLNNVKAHYQQSVRYDKTTNNQFTGREKEIIRHLCQGLTYKEIARSLYVSTSTVKTAMGTIYSKLGASNKADAVRIAIHLEMDR